MLEYAGKGELYKQLLKLRRFSDSRGSRVRPPLCLKIRTL